MESDEHVGDVAVIRSAMSIVGSMRYSGSSSGLDAGGGGGIASGTAERFHNIFSRTGQQPTEEDDARKAGRDAVNARAIVAREQASAPQTMLCVVCRCCTACDGSELLSRWRSGMVTVCHIVQIARCAALTGSTPVAMDQARSATAWPGSFVGIVISRCIN